MMDQQLASTGRRVSDHFAIEIFYIAIIPLKYSRTLELQFTILNQTLLLVMDRRDLLVPFVMSGPLPSPLTKCTYAYIEDSLRLSLASQTQNPSAP